MMQLSLAVTASTTIGTPLPEKTLAAVIDSCEQVLTLSDNKQKMLAFVESRMAVVAPNLLHHLYVGEWMEAYPKARSFAAEGVAAKRPELSFSATLGSAFDESFGEDVERFPIDGMPGLNESLFVHRTSRTLIATDFCFYMPKATGFAAVFAALMGIRTRVRVEPIFKALIRDKAAFRASLVPLRALQIDHLSMCHHAVISEDATTTLQAVLDQVKVPPRVP